MLTEHYMQLYSKEKDERHFGDTQGRFYKQRSLRIHCSQVTTDFFNQS